MLFQTTKIQIFESNSQLGAWCPHAAASCFRQQRYKFLKAIHNHVIDSVPGYIVVSDNKDTNFWKQFTTIAKNTSKNYLLFQTTKIQIFESNSQLQERADGRHIRCFRQQRYKFLKAIHNLSKLFTANGTVVSDNKDTNFWKQFTTI